MSTTSQSSTIPALFLVGILFILSIWTECSGVPWSVRHQIMVEARPEAVAFLASRPTSYACHRTPSRNVASIRKSQIATSTSTSTRTSPDLNGDRSDPLVSSTFPDRLIESLDLIPVIYGVASHAGTRRGHQALLSMVKEDQTSVLDKYHLRNRLFGTTSTSSLRQRAEFTSTPTAAMVPRANKKKSHRAHTTALAPIARNAKAARNEYNLIEAATLALSKNDWNVTVPPLYGVNSDPWDKTTIAETDDDEWLSLPADTWTLEQILQAEKVVQTLLETKLWASKDSTQQWASSLSEIGSNIDMDEVLPSVLAEISGRVEIVRVRSLMDPDGKASFSFRLNTDRYPVLRILREKEEQLLRKGGKALDKKVLALQTEIDNVEMQIRSGLAQLVLSVSSVVDTGLDLVGRLDVIFAKSAFGVTLNGVIPLISDEGKISVQDFIHPVLAMNEGFAAGAAPGEAGHVVAVDLRLPAQDDERALLISGPNGGGKTLSMKSFGLVSVLSKIGIPIPIAGSSSPRPRIDFIDDVLINLGDKQSVVEGESTWTSILNSCAEMIEHVKKNPDRNVLVLLDELGSGTDPEAGGAIAQAILEDMMLVPGCRIVATTHSPRLKTLSYDDSNFGCATVLLQNDKDSDYKQPTFRLEYGIIGESYAMGAASRCSPSLPPSVLTRASHLLSQDSSEDTDTRGSYIQALTSSMEEQLERMQHERQVIEQSARDAQECRRAMVSLASSYELNLDRLEKRLDDGYRRLRQDGKKNDLEVLGETLEELKVTKKMIQTQRELLREKGLKLVPISYQLSVGESVVIVAEDTDWDGSTAEVVADGTTDRTLGHTGVLVRLSSDLMAWNDMRLDGTKSNDDMMDRPWIVQRHELAIWDYDSMWEDDGRGGVIATSVPDSKRRLGSVLSTLKSTSSSSIPLLTGPGKSTKVKTPFSSARTRKAANKGKKKKK